MANDWLTYIHSVYPLILWLLWNLKSLQVKFGRGREFTLKTRR